MRFSRVVRPFLCAVVVTVLAPGAAKADPSVVAAKMATLKTSIESKQVKNCLGRFVLLRRLGNTCTLALNALVGPITEALVALDEEETRLRNDGACPTVYDYGCTPKQIQTREIADHLHEALWQLQLAYENSLEDRHDGAWWDRWFLSDNHLSVIWAGDFVGKAVKAYEEAVAAAAADPASFKSRD